MFMANKINTSEFLHSHFFFYSFNKQVEKKDAVATGLGQSAEKQ